MRGLSPSGAYDSGAGHSELVQRVAGKAPSWKLRELEEEKRAGAVRDPGPFYASELPRLVAGSKNR